VTQAGLPREVRRLAVVLLLVALIACVIDATTRSLDAWMPNVAVDAVSIALTVTVIERLLRRAHTRRLRPWTEHAYTEVYMALVTLVFGGEGDDDSWLPDVRSFVDDWAIKNQLDDYVKAAIPAFSRLLRDIRARHLHVLDVTVIVAIDHVVRVSDRLVLSAFSPPEDAEIPVGTYFAGTVLGLLNALSALDPARFSEG
jgi:hypothetical protein